MESDKIGVSLGLDLSEYSRSIQDALKILDKFEKNFANEFKINVDTSSIAKVATKELDKLQKALQKIDDNDYELNIKYKYAKEELGNALEQQKMSYGRRGEVEKADKRVSVAQENLESIKARIHANDVAAEDIKSRIDDLFNDLINLSELKFENINNIGLATGAREIQKMAEHADQLNDTLDESPKRVRKTTHETTILGTVFARLAKQIKRQMYTSIASLLNPINQFRKVFSYLTDVISPRLGATFKNIGNNFIEYIADSELFKNLIEQILYLVYALQNAFNSVARLFGFRQIDLFKTSKKSAKEIEKSASNTVASFDEINDIGSQGNDDDVPLSLSELNLSDKSNIIFASINDTIGKLNNMFENADFVKLGKDFANKFTKIFTSFDWGGLGELLGNLLISTLETAGSFMFNTDWASINNKLIDFITNLVDRIKIFLSETDWKKVIDDTIDKIIETVKNTDWSKLLISIFEALGAALPAISTIIDELNRKIIKVVVDSLVKYFSKYIEIDADDNWLEIGGKIIGGIFQGIIDALVNVGEWIYNNIVKPFVNRIKDKFGIHSPSTVMRDIGKNLIDGLKEGLGNIWSAVKDKFETMKTKASETFKNLKSSIADSVDKIKNKFNEIKNFKFSDFSIKVTAKVDEFKNKMKSILNNSDVLSSVLGWASSKISSAKNWIASLDVGTNYVPNDQLAMIHKGEAIIPKKFNERTYFGNNDETNSLLEQLIEKVDNIDFAPYTTVKDVGRASVDYIKNTSRRLGRSVI